MARNIANERLYIGGVATDATALTNGNTYYSDPIRANHNTGYSALVLKISGGAPDLTITYQVSTNGKDFYDPIDPYGTALGPVYTNLTSSAWISFSPYPAEYIRFAIVCTADATITGNYIQQEETV